MLVVQGQVAYYANCSTVQTGRYKIVFDRQVSDTMKSIAENQILNEIAEEDCKEYEPGPELSTETGWYFCVRRDSRMGFTQREWEEYSINFKAELGFQPRATPPERVKYFRRFQIGREGSFQWLTDQLIDDGNTEFPEPQNFSEPDYIPWDGITLFLYPNIRGPDDVFRGF